MNTIRTANSTPIERVNLLGVGVSALNMELAVQRVVDALDSRTKGYVCVTGVHGVMEAQKDEQFRRILNNAFLVTPDGMPLVWWGKMKGLRYVDRVYGPDLMLEILQRSVTKGYRHFFYGGANNVTGELAARMKVRFPGIQIAGTYEPPFRPLTAVEAEELMNQVRGLNVDIFWVGLSTPKQEKFMAEFLPRLDTTLMFGVGAAFDFHSGRVRQAPAWIQRSGFEWLFRLSQEPRRLWRRYLFNNPRFLFRTAGQALGLKKYDLEQDRARISIFGLGYVGAVAAGCLARRGHQVIGVDIHSQKVEALNRGVAPIFEPGLDLLLRNAQGKGLLRATEEAKRAVAESDLSIVCVGTPSTDQGTIDVSFVRTVLKQIGAALAARPKRHIVIVRSTLLPGTTEQLVDESFGTLPQEQMPEVLYHPEFLRESSAVEDFDHPSIMVVGTRDGKPPSELAARVIGGPTVVVDWRTAEMLKFACNAFHAAKVVFGNEVGRLSKRLGIDGQRVMELLCKDTKLNLSSYYLSPGNPFGGSCLPKDVQAFADCAARMRLDVPLIANLIPSNQAHLASLLARITALDQREVVILGLSFKNETDDLRGSAMLEVARTLIGQGFTVRIYDPNLKLDALVGSNRRVVQEKLPQLGSLLHKDLAAAFGKEGLIVAAQRCASIADISKVLTRQHKILDVNGWPELKTLPAEYDGFCW